jgi:hypothetical protein
MGSRHRQAFFTDPVPTFFAETGEADLHALIGLFLKQVFGLIRQVDVETAAQTAVGGANTMLTFLGFSRGTSKGLASSPAFSARLPSTSENLAAYGRNDSIADCAPRNRDAATMFIALVICLVFLTPCIFRSTSFSCWHTDSPYRHNG